MEISEVGAVLNTTVEAVDNRTIFESFVKLHLIEDIDSTSLKMPEKARRKDIGRKQWTLLVCLTNDLIKDNFLFIQSFLKFWAVDLTYHTY